MYYALSEEKKTRPLVVGTCDGEPDVTTLDYLKTRGLKLYSLEEAIALGTVTRNRLGKEIWLGVNIWIKMDGHVLMAKWLDKWRTIAYYQYLRKPSDKWVASQLRRVLGANIPLDPETKILFRWEV